jgi:hypothetical protein
MLHFISSVDSLREFLTILFSYRNENFYNIAMIISYILWSAAYGGPELPNGYVSRSGSLGNDWTFTYNKKFASQNRCLEIACQKVGIEQSLSYKKTLPQQLNAYTATETIEPEANNRKVRNGVLDSVRPGL